MPNSLHRGFFRDDVTGALLVTGLVSPLFPGWRAGRTFSWATNPSDFVTLNFDVVTDGGRPALKVHDGNGLVEASAFTVVTDIPSARVDVLYRALPYTGADVSLDITNVAVMPTIRRSDANNMWYTLRARGVGNSSLSSNEKVAGSPLGGAAFDGDLAMDNTDTTTYWWLRTDVFWDVIRAKEWSSTGAEPGWKGLPKRLRGFFGYGATGETSNDNVPETGTAGVRVMYGSIIQDIRVTELVSLA